MSAGAYDEEESAARAYDLAALKYWGTSTFTNFPVSDYESEIDLMNTLTKEEYLASLRRYHFIFKLMRSLQPTLNVVQISCQ